MGLAAAVPAALGLAGSIFGASKQAGSQNKALQAQQQANQQAMAYQQQQQATAKRMAQSRWNDYTKRLEMWYRANPNAASRYGYLPGYKSEWSTPAAGTPGAPGAPGAPGSAPGPVTLAGGRQVGGQEYADYVKQREARRAQQPQTLGGIMGGHPGYQIQT